MVLDHWSNDAMVSMDRRGLGQLNESPHKILTVWTLAFQSPAGAS